MEKHNGLIHIRVITLQISPWKIVYIEVIGVITLILFWDCIA